MSKASIINYLDSYLKDFCRQYPEYQIFRIGSSLFESEIAIHDIDYFLVNENSSENYKERIHNLKANFSGKDFLKSAVYTDDSLIDGLLKEVEANIAVDYGCIVQHVFGFGPIVMPVDKEILILHLAGPMNADSCNSFFSQFPLFHFLWSRYNLQLGKKAFDEVITPPEIRREDIKEEYVRIFTRASTIDNPYIKRQCLKRLLLVELALENHPSPFVESVQIVMNKTDEQILTALEKFGPIGD